MPEPSVTTSLRSDGKHSVFVSLANERHEPRRGVQVTFIQGGKLLTGDATTTNEQGFAACIAEPGKIAVQVPGFSSIEKDLEKPAAKPVQFPKAPDGMTSIWDAIRRAWRDSRVIKKGGTP